MSDETKVAEEELRKILARGVESELLRCKLEAIAADLSATTSSSSPQDAVKEEPLVEEVPRSEGSLSVKSQTEIELKNKKWTALTKFAWDQESNFVNVYVSLPNVGEAADNVRVNFTEKSFDLTVENLRGENFRLLKTNLEHEVMPGQSKFKVKENRVVIKLRKADGKYGPEHWSALVAKRKTKSASGDPTESLNDMMRELYEGGDDEMKKTIGEAMLKARKEPTH